MDVLPLREALRVRRLVLHLSLDALAEKTGINRATIHSIENVKREPDLKPRIQTLEALGAAMGLSLSVSFLRDTTGHNPASGAAEMTSPDNLIGDKSSGVSLIPGELRHDRVDGVTAEARALAQEAIAAALHLVGHVPTISRARTDRKTRTARTKKRPPKR